MIAGCEAAWAFFGGVFKVVIPDNMSAIVDQAHPTEPRLNQAFVEYAQDRGFVIDPARVRPPTDKPRVERMVPFVRGSFFAGEHFIDLADAQRRAEAWCAGRAGQRIHRTTRCRPAELFAAGGGTPAAARAGVRPTTCRSTPARRCTATTTSRSPRRCTRCRANLIGRHVDVRADRQLVRVFHRGALVKVHPRARPGGRVTDPADLPADKTAYAMRDLATCSAWPTTPGRRSAPTPRRCWTIRCRGPRCARSTRCWAWSASGGRAASRPPARGRWTPRPSASR